MKNKGFTLIELLIVIAIVAIIAAAVFIVLNPVTRFEDARNSERQSAVESIADAVRIYQVDNDGELPPGVDATLKMLGTSGTGCNVDCGSTSEVFYHSTTESLNYYSNNTYSVRNWFDVSSLENFESLTVSAVLDCNGSCSGNVRVRIGNASSYNDYDFVNSSSIRTDGTTSDYTWYTNMFSVNKNTLGDYFFVQLLLYSGSGTVRFMMDEQGPAGPDPEYRSGSNGNGSQTGWHNDNGDYFIKIELPEATASACLDLNSSLSGYLGFIPIDPKEGTAAKTYYAIKINSPAGIAASVNVISCASEKGEVIEVNK